jgi:hypothetical protein
VDTKPGFALENETPKRVSAIWTCALPKSGKPTPDELPRSQERLAERIDAGIARLSAIVPALAYSVRLRRLCTARLQARTQRHRQCVRVVKLILVRRVEARRDEREVVIDTGAADRAPRVSSVMQLCAAGLSRCTVARPSCPQGRPQRQSSHRPPAVLRRDIPGPPWWHWRQRP